MIAFREIVRVLRTLDIDPESPVIVHASLSSIGGVQGGAETVLGALLYLYDGLMMPAFTFKTMIVPEVGPEDNAIEYGSGKDANRMASFWHPKLPVDRSLGVLPEALRRHPRVKRSSHPILSFSAVNLDEALASQNLDEPLAPLKWLLDVDGWVLLLGVDQTSNTAIHLAEQLAGRKQFVRWALTPQEIVECPAFPGCSKGFNAIQERVKPIVRQIQLGDALVQAMPMRGLVDIVVEWLHEDPLALLCDDPDCAKCQVIRNAASQD